MPVRGWGRTFNSHQHRRAKYRLATSVEALESRQLLAAAVVSERDYQVSPSSQRYDFPTYGDGGSVPLESGQYAIDGSIDSFDNDWFSFNLRAGEQVTIQLSADEFFSQFIDTGFAFGATAVAQANDISGDDPVIDTHAGSNSASASASDHAEFASLSSSASISASRSLLSGSGSWSLNLQTSADNPEFPEGEGTTGTASVSAFLPFLTNRSGVLTLNGDPSEVLDPGVFGASGFFMGRAKLEDYAEYIVELGLEANSPLFGLGGNGSETFTASDGFSWTFTPDEFHPTFVILGGDEMEPVQGTDSLTFVAPHDGTYTLVIAHNGQYYEVDEDPIGLRAPYGYYRPYHAEVTLPGVNRMGITAQYNDYESSTAPPPRGVARLAAPIVDSERCGPYLPGVDLPNTFTVRLDEQLDDVASVTWTLGNNSGTAVKSPGAANTWTFNVNMGNFAAATRDLVVKAKNSAGDVLEEETTSVIHQGAIDFELAVKAGTSNSVGVEGVRFFKDVAANVLFDGQIFGMASFYQNRVQVFVGTSRLQATVTGDPGQPQVFTASRNVGDLPLGSTAVTITVGSVQLSNFGDVPEFISSVSVPSWLSGANKAYNGTTVEYEFHNASPALLNYQASLPKTGVKWIDKELKKLRSFFTLTPTLNIDAPLQTVVPVHFSGSEVHVEAQLLGQTLFEETFKSDELEFVGELNALTLAPTALGIKLKDPLEFESTFLDESFSINLLEKAGIKLPDSVASAKLELALKVLGGLTVDAGVLLALEGSSLVFVSTGTFIKVTATPQAVTTATLTAKVLGGWLADFNGTFDATTTITISGSVNFAGAVSSPRIDRTTLVANLKIEYRVRIKGTLAKKRTLVDFDSASPENGGPTDDVLGPYELLALSKV